MNGDSPVQVTLPRMGFLMTSISYEADSNLQRNHHKAYQSSRTRDDRYKVRATTVPYMLEFSLYIVARNMSEILAIKEQIIPHFRPSLSIAIRAGDPEEEFIDHYTATLSDISLDIDYEGDFESSRRLLSCEMSFSMNVRYFPPSSEQPPITSVEINIESQDSRFGERSSSGIESGTKTTITGSRDTSTGVITIQAGNIEEIFRDDLTS